CGVLYYTNFDEICFKLYVIMEVNVHMRQQLFKSINVYHLCIGILVIALMVFISMSTLFDSFMELIRHKDQVPRENSVLVIQQYPSKQEIFKNNLLLIIKSALK
ncbi:hypothetical protein, partial [Anaerosolibacter sp.]|uniref:hypothetical protein n=1 Tax=Anaerosolibacter sp. TaxID=1872527 RepID=UPI0039F0D862